MLPKEKQKEVIRKRPLRKSKTVVKEWEPEITKEEEAANKVQSDLPTL